MADQEATSPPGSRTLPLVAIILIVLFLGVALFGERGILRALQYSRHKQALEAEVRQLEETSAELRREIDSLRNDLRTIEGIARRELGMVKDDELVYQFRPAPAVDPSTTRSAAVSSDPLPQQR